VGLAELFVAVLIAGVSAINAAVPFAAYRRTRDARFLLLAGAGLGFLLFGLLATWGQLPVSPPSWTGVSLPLLGLLWLVTLLLLAATLLPRRA
jgi:hypothetical protein